MKKLIVFLISVWACFIAQVVFAQVAPVEYGQGPPSGLLEFPVGSEFFVYGKLTNGELAFPGEEKSEIGLVADPMDEPVAPCDWAERRSTTLSLTRNANQLFMFAEGYRQNGVALANAGGQFIPTINMVRIGIRTNQPEALRHMIVFDVFVNGLEAPVALQARGTKSWTAVDIPIPDSNWWSVSANVEYGLVGVQHPLVEVFAVPYYNHQAAGQQAIINAIKGSMVKVKPVFDSSPHPANHLAITSLRRAQSSSQIEFLVQSGFLTRKHTIMTADESGSAWIPLYSFYPEMPDTTVEIHNLLCLQKLFRVVVD